MMFKGLQLTPEEAEQISLVNVVYPKSELEEKTFDYAARLARQATGAIAKIKRCVNTGLYEGFARGLADEQKAFKENITSPDVREGVEAFLEGRKPEFQGFGSEESSAAPEPPAASAPPHRRRT
jgi:enoyl-CoA hydratase